MTAAPCPTAGRYRRIGWIAALLLATLAVYMPAIRGGWIWDDDYYVTNNIHLHTLHGLRQLWLRPGAVPQYYPLTHTTFWIEYHLWGNRPLGYHLDNVLLHIANAVMVGLILRRLNVPGYALAAAVFALHPVEVESVAWVTERKNVLSGLLYLSAMWIALDVWSIAFQRPRRRPILAYLACLGLFILSLLSKSVTASFPVVVLLLIWWKRGRVTFRQVGSLLPFFASGLAMGSVTAWMEKHVVGAMGDDWNWTLSQRILIAGKSIWLYLAKLAYPYPLIFIYPRWTVDTASPWQWLFPIGVVVLLGLLFWMRGRLGRGPWVAALFFIITIAPALGFVNVYPMRFTFFADHYQYLAGIGPISLAAALLGRMRIPVGLIWLLILGALTYRQSSVYHDSVTLWSDVVSKDANSPIGHGNLGTTLADRGDTAAAESELRRAIAIDPHWVDAWIELGLLAEADNPQAAMDFYHSAQAIAPRNPLPAWRQGMLDRKLGDNAQAESEFAIAAQYLPNPAPAYEQIGEIELSLNHPDAGAAEFRRALQHDPDRVDAHNNLAAIFLRDASEPSTAAAQEQCRASLAIDPNNLTANNNMGITLARQGRAAEAAVYFNRALQIDPAFDMARENLSKLGKRD